MNGSCPVRAARRPRVRLRHQPRRPARGAQRPVVRRQPWSRSVADRDEIEGLARARAGRASPPSSCRSRTSRPDDWDAALTEAVAAHDPTLVVSAGFMKILGRALPRPGFTTRQHPPGAAARLSGRARGARCSRLRRQGHRRHACTSSTRASTPGPSSPGRRRRSLDDDDEASTARTDQGGRAGDARRRGRTDGARRWQIMRQEGHDRMTTRDERPIKRALVSVYDKTGLDELGKALGRGRVSRSCRPARPPPGSATPASR